MRRFDVQAKYAMYCSIGAILGLGGLAVLIFRNFRKLERAVVFSRESMFAPAVFVVTAATLLLAATAAMMGFNSAGQKRNTNNKQSWIAFFVGTAAASLTIILFGMFWFYKLRI
ncbi:MAG: hypothetical protein DHS20C16_06250 [Phycisphaerae bacterium]|nr:MAG: hypothetical protein DHS20C16_06250 [Phycisphaerae bacterium]